MEIYSANLLQSLIPHQYTEEFEQQLTDAASLTLVFTIEDRVVACGTISHSPQEASAWLSFGLVDPAFQRRGIGEKGFPKGDAFNHQWDVFINRFPNATPDEIIVFRDRLREMTKDPQAKTIHWIYGPGER